MATVSRSSMSDSTLLGLALLNFFLADARDGLGPFLDAFLATQGWSPLTLGAIATVGGLIGLALTPFAGALVDRSRWKRALIAVPVVIVTAGALLTLLVPHPTVVWAGTIATAVLGVVIAPALAGLSLGLVGQRAFPRQISRNEFWNHSGNLASLMGIYLAVSLFGQFSVVWLMIITALGALIALLMISPDRIDHDVARGMVKDAGTDDRARPSGLSVLLHNRGLVVLAIVMMLFHFGNAPMSRLIAQEFSIQLGTPFRTTALITGVAQATMIAVAASTPWLIRRLGLRLCFLIALCALPLRGILAGSIPDFWVVVPVQMLDGIGAGMLGILTPVAAERLLANTGHFNLGFAAVMTVQGIGATFSNVIAGWIVSGHGYGLSHFVGAGVAVAALLLFLIYSRVVVPTPNPEG